VSSKTLFYSVLVHVAVAGAMLLAAERNKGKKNIAVAVVDEKKAKPKEEKKPPPPKPIVAPPVVHKAAPAPKAAAPVPVASAPEPSAKSSAPAPVDTGLTLGDADGPGIDIGGPAVVKAPAPKPKDPTAPSIAPKKIGPVIKKPDANAEEECTEDPTKPEPITRPEIEYTTAARAAGVEGRLVLRLTIAADGTVSKSDVVSSVDAGLDAAAIATVEHWRFKPSTRCGKPFAGGIYTLARRFELGD
jgi:protein TonB